MDKPLTTTSTGWIGCMSWVKQPCAVMINGNQSSVLFETRREAKEAGWDKPVKVTISIKKVRHAKR